MNHATVVLCRTIALTKLLKLRRKYYLTIYLFRILLFQHFFFFFNILQDTSKRIWLRSKLSQTFSVIRPKKLFELPGHASNHFSGGAISRHLSR